MATIAADMKSQGKEVINFSVGEPDFNTQNILLKLLKMLWMLVIPNILQVREC